MRYKLQQKNSKIYSKKQSTANYCDHRLAASIKKLIPNS